MFAEGGQKEIIRLVGMELRGGCMPGGCEREMPPTCCGQCACRLARTRACWPALRYRKKASIGWY